MTKTARKTTIGDMIAGVSVIALACAVPVQCRRALEADDRRVMVEYHEEMARYFGEMESQPFPWIDEFRAPLRLLQAQELAECKRLRSAFFFIDPAAAPISGAGMSPAEIRQLWSRFEIVARKNGFRRPRTRWPPVGGTKALTAYGALGKYAPTIGVAVGLAWLLARRFRGRTHRATSFVAMEALQKALENRRNLL